MARIPTRAPSIRLCNHRVDCTFGIVHFSSAIPPLGPLALSSPDACIFAVGYHIFPLAFLLGVPTLSKAVFYDVEDGDALFEALPALRAWKMGVGPS